MLEFTNILNIRIGAVGFLNWWLSIHLIHHILIHDVADMLHFIFSEKRVKNLKQPLICIRYIPNTYFWSTLRMYSFFVVVDQMRIFKISKGLLETLSYRPQHFCNSIKLFALSALYTIMSHAQRWSKVSIWDISNTNQGLFSSNTSDIKSSQPDVVQSLHTKVKW
jgi:hypothetical protein